jgi:Chloroplast envelope transporter
VDLVSVETKGDRLNPFDLTAVPERRSWVARLFRRRNPEAALAEIQNLLASHGLNALQPSDVSAILTARKVSGRGARTLARTLWARALREFARDDVLSNEEIAYLARLRAALGLAERDAQEMQTEFAQRRYGELLSEALTDERLSDEEWDRLNRLAESTGLSKEVRATTHGEGVRRIYETTLHAAVGDRRLSETEDRHLKELAQNLGVTTKYDAGTEALLQKFAYLWRIENGELPSITAPIALQKGEVCHLATQTAWHELRTRTVRVNYSGTTSRIRITKGLSFRVGSVTPQRVTRDEITPIDSGTVYVTNKRIIFDGQKKNATIRYGALLGIEVFSDAIKLEKATGRSPYLLLSGDIEIAAAIISEALARA